MQLRDQAAAAEAHARELARAQEDQLRHLGRVRMEYRQGLLEAQRLLPLYRKAYHQSMLPLYRGDAGMQQEVARYRDALVELVGEAEVLRVSTDASYSPWWRAAS